MLKGYDQLLNLVLDEAVEYLRGAWSSCPGDRVARPAAAWLQQCSNAVRPCYIRCWWRASQKGAQCTGMIAWCTAVTRRTPPHSASPFPPCLPLHLLADPEDPMRVTDATRSLGLIVCRGTSVMLVVPTAGTEEIANPFQQEMEG